MYDGFNLQALKAFECFLIYGLKVQVAPRAHYDRDRNYVNLHHFLRVMSTPHVVGHAAIEGTHQV